MASLNFIKIAKIGENEQISNIKNRNLVTTANTIMFERKSYRLLIEVGADQVLKDIKKVPAFNLKAIEDDSKTILWLTLSPDLMHTDGDISLLYFSAAQRLIDIFFVINKDNLFSENDENDEEKLEVDGQTKEKNRFGVEKNVPTNKDFGDSNYDDDDDDDDDSDCLPKVSIDDLYQQLREAHHEFDNFDNNYSDEMIQHKHLKPTLTNYQICAVKWMLNRESAPDSFSSEFKEVTKRWSSDNSCDKFFYNPRTAQLITNQNDDVAIPSGGILADEMGLGKTVETLALILSNQRAIKRTANNNQIDVVSQNDEIKPPKETVEAEEIALKCLCVNKSIKTTIKCTRCSTSQHRLCVFPQTQNQSVITDDIYICPVCWQNEDFLLSKTTFIVSPSSIKMQWYDEVKKHISDEDFKVYIYEGIKKSGWISPVDLAAHDIVLTDYNTLQSEIYYSNLNQTTRTLRKPSRYISLKSPLLQVDWWRICLDEAQMVGSIIKNTAKMVAQLTAVHRWAVTGTPIEKSINDLYGLIYYLNCSPYDERKKWNELADEFVYNTNVKPMVSVLRRVMWRTCKSKFIMDQINIPEQTEIVHYVKLSDLELFFYNSQHKSCLDAFYEKTRSIGRHMKLVTLNPHIFNLIMDPLRKLRQDCSVPSTFDKSQKSIVKRTLKPDELLKHLISNSEIDAKSQLRTIGSSLNGLAALHIIKNNRPEASKMYNRVVQWAKDYTGPVTVDSLLQIHALHNLLLIDHNLSVDDKCSHQAELNRLEMKYIQNNVKLVADLRIEQKKWAQKINKIKSKFNANEYQWWLDTLAMDKSDPNRLDLLLRKINEDILAQYNYTAINWRAVDGLKFVLSLWLDKINDERQKVKIEFQKLKFFMTNLKPVKEIDVELRGKFETFLNTAFKCHLDLTDHKGTSNKRKKSLMCMLCKAKLQLETYECIIFDKKLVQHQTKSNMITQGTWNAPYQEAILKIILSQIKGTDIDQRNREDGKMLFQLLEALKSEFKEYSQLWVEVNYTVSAYDEINMCKSRLRAVDPENLTDPSELNSNLTIDKYEIDDTMQQFESQLKEAELQFVRKLGQLKYLNHLEKKKDVENCPICSTKPKEKYVVLQCGHHMCMICFLRWIKTTGAVLTCFICRHVQKQSQLYFVTLNSDNKLTDSSSKIEEIVQTIEKLMRQDKNVKIVIFSHWTTVLKVIEIALADNKIRYRSQLAKFHETIRDFKDPELNVTCLLLPLSYGSKGLNLIEATHVFLVEPILNPGEELQAISRIHRIGQTKKTFVHRFIVRNTIEESIYKTISNDHAGIWSSQKCTIENLLELFKATDNVEIE